MIPFRIKVYVALGNLKIGPGESVACLSYFFTADVDLCSFFPPDEQYNSRVEWKRFADFSKLQFVTRQDEREGCSRLTSSFVLFYGAKLL
jgi:hypothetical protein